MTGFASQVKAFTVKVTESSDELLRAVALELLSRMVLRSPVGNPELWAANQHAQEARKAVRDAAYAEGSTVGKATLTKMYPFAAGKGYVGGRFRGSWTVSLSVPSSDSVGTIDASGGKTITVGEGVLQDAKTGVTIYIINSLPYSERLEDGWSKQAPAGVVKVTVAEFQTIVDDAAKGVL
jgi:hypothetical protein